LLVDALAAAELPMIGDDAGAHLVVPLPSAAAERDALAEAERRGLRLDGLGRHHAGRPRWHGVLIGYAACSRGQLAAALPDLVALLTAVPGARGASEGTAVQVWSPA
jgi:GntR family transcriptional regulator/MocR family aminotransferase